MPGQERSASRGYDIIGDIHGCAHTLVRLLDQMGYRKVNGVYEHPRRQAIFIGDIIDRGPRIREALHLVRDMVEHGSARIVMGTVRALPPRMERVSGVVLHHSPVYR